LELTELIAVHVEACTHSHLVSATLNSLSLQS
jgi:hypothetical protein